MSFQLGYPDDKRHHVSHEAIYKTLHIQTRGALKQGLLSCLRTQRAMSHSRQTSKRTGPGKIVDVVPNSGRPSTVEDRATLGHWEGDLIVGTNNNYIATLVERHSRFVMLALLRQQPGQEAGKGWEIFRRSVILK